jgi:deoxyadenosine/deoxycytidine kinase
LNTYYDKWIADYKDGPLLVVEVDHMDFAENEEDFAKIISKINAQINGLF